MLPHPCRSRTPPLSRAPPAFPHVSLVRCLCHIQHPCPARPDAHICSETVSSGAHRLGRSPGDPARRWSLGFTRPTAVALIMHMEKCYRVGDVDSRRLRCGSVKPQPRFPRLMSFEVRRRSCCRYWAFLRRSEVDCLCAYGRCDAMGGGRTMQGVGAPTPLASGKTTNETTANNTVTRDTHTPHTHTP